MKIEKWVCITIEYRTKERQRVVLFRYDLPRDVYERRQWVVRWRHARLLCQYPKENVQTYFSLWLNEILLATQELLEPEK